MVDAIVDIPLPGQIIESQRDEPNALRGKRDSPIFVDTKIGTVPGTAPVHFLAGPENRLVPMAVRCVLEEQPNGYNPIVLYGPSGTGKTHLALGMAAAWKAREQSTGLRPAPVGARRRAECISAVDFARELAEAIETQAVEEFRAKYRQAGLLVIEDIARLVNRKSEKLSAQDELLHTLDELIGRGAWVIITSLTAPGEIAGMLPTLQSRLCAGLTIPLALPEQDTRFALLQRLAEARKIDLPGPVARMLADGFFGTAPELMGALVQLEVLARRDGAGIDVHAVGTLLSKRHRRGGPSLHDIALASAKRFGLKLAELHSPSREQTVVAARNTAIYLARNLLKCSFEQIGQFFGRRHHTTVMHSWQKMDKLLKTDIGARHEVERLTQEILNSHK